MTEAPAVSTTSQTMGGIPSALLLRGACSYNNHLNGLVFELQGMTANGAPFYKADGLNEYIYHDVDCDGSAGAAPRWILDNTAPDLTALADLDRDEACQYRASFVVESVRVPSGSSPVTWRMYCGSAEGWRGVEITLEPLGEGQNRTTTTAESDNGKGVMPLSSASDAGPSMLPLVASIFLALASRRM